MTDILDQCAGLEEVHHDAGDVLLCEGGRGGALYILIEGEIAIAKNGTHLLSITEPGAVFGEMAALLGGQCSATVSVLAPSRLRFCADGPALLVGNPALTLHASRVLARRLQAATAYLADLKVQFEGRDDHFGMMDQILETLMQKQGGDGLAQGALSGQDDPRL